MPTDLSALLERSAAALAELADFDLDDATDPELTEAVEVFQRLRGRLEAVEARVLARWDARGCWRPSGARSSTAWMRSTLRLPKQVAGQRVRHARALRAFPAIDEAWAAGEVDRAHLVTLLGTRNPRTEEAFQDHHKALLDSARTRSFSEFQADCDRFEQEADPDGAERKAEDQRADRDVYLVEGLGGMWLGKMTLDPVSGTIVSGTLRGIEQELFEADWAEARARLGRDPFAFELRRTPAQRRADALTEMAIRARTAPKDGRRPAPLFTVVVDHQTLMGPVLELFNRRRITPGTAAAWLSQADVERIVFDGPSRVLDVGVTRRFFRGALRRAIEVRDRTCYHPTCDEPPERPQVDHIQEASKGGQTTQWNGRLACGFHNRWRNLDPDDDDEPDPP